VRLEVSPAGRSNQWRSPASTSIITVLGGAACAAIHLQVVPLLRPLSAMRLWPLSRPF